MGKGKKSSNGVNVQVGDVDRTVINASGTHFSGGVHLNLGDDADDAQETELVQPDENTMLLFRILSTKFTLEELESVCWEIGIRFENLPAKTLSGKARQLVQKVSDLNVMTKLIAIVNRERPDAGIKSLQEI